MKTKLLAALLMIVTAAGIVWAQSAGSYTEKDLVWQDDFNGKALNMDDWNYEYHEPGWVNNELQEYVDAKENIYVKGGNLIIQPIQKKDKNGKITYTSGRINTQHKHDFTYGRFEARLKVPAGQGFLPAFWMMPTEENLYGQWPKCGEIDIMEVLGNVTNKTYGTIHFGEPHAERQGSKTLAKGDFNKEFHVYAVEWDPGEIRFYLDGEMYFKTSDWFTKKDGFGEITYPAPFDQSFYMIFNVAVGGNWPGNPDKTTKFGKNAQMVVDYVKVYQKKSYDENVQKPAGKNKEMRKPDKDGNYVRNPGFTEAESLKDNTVWGFLTAGTGKATAEIKDNMLIIKTEDAGSLDYSVQVIQPDIPMEKGASYRYEFDAWASENRTIIPAITAPNAGWIRYFPDTKTEITTERKHYSFDFDMKSKSDPTGRVEFNLGNQGSTATVYITDVSVKMTRSADGSSSLKTVLPDGNYIYNGEFQEGKNRLEFWDIVNNCKGSTVEVTNQKNVRELKVTCPKGQTNLEDISLSQGDLTLSLGGEYILYLDGYADANKTITAVIDGQSFSIPLTTKKQTIKNKFTVRSKAKTNTLTLLLGVEGTTYIDNVRVQEDGLLLNGNFTSDMTGYEVYTHEASKTDYAVDNLTEKGAFCMNISNTGTMDWHIQLKQNHIILEKDKWYELSFDAKSSFDRTIMYALQRDGSSDNNWEPYSGTQKIKVKADYQNYKVQFQMKSETDKDVILSISMGAVDNKVIKDKHTVCLDNIKLIEIEK